MSTATTTKAPSEPALIIAVISAALGLAATLGIHGLSSGKVALIVAAINAIAAIITAWRTRPIAPSLFTGAANAVIALAAAYGLHLPQSTIGALNVLVIAVLALMTRGQVSPVPRKTRKS